MRYCTVNQYNAYEVTELSPTKETTKWIRYQSMPNPDKILSLYINRDDIGLSLFSPTTLQIQCSELLSYCYLDYQNIGKVFTNCSKIITNDPKHEIFTHCSIRASGCSQKDMEMDSTSNLVRRMRGSDEWLIKCMMAHPLRYKALGILLGYLFQHTDSTHNIIGASLHLDHIQYFIDTLLRRVQIGQHETWFLQLQKEEIHPSAIKGKGNSKEGFSLLSVFQSFVKTNGGMHILKSIFLNPIYDQTILQSRIDLWEWIRDNMKDKVYNKVFRRLFSVEVIIRKMNKAKEEEDDWKKFIRTIDSICELRSLIVQPFLPLFVQKFIQDEGWTSLTQLRMRLSQTVSLNPFCIRQNVNEDLDSLRQNYHELPTILTKLTEGQKQRNRLSVPFRIIFMAQLGYLLRVDPNAGDVDEQWRLQFVNGMGRYYRNALTQQLDQEYGDVFGGIQDIERRILLNLVEDILRIKSIILKLYWNACYIECLWSISFGCISFCKPRFSSQSFVVLNSWHILLGQTAVSNHIFSFPHHSQLAPKHYNSESNLVNTNYSNRLMMLSGPNGSGKTAYLKQLAMMLYLGHIGFFLPAEAAQIPLIDRLAVVLSEKTIYEMCGFENQLHSLATVLNKRMITSKSVILIDELGAEADYQYALKILYATVKCLEREGEFRRNIVLQREDDEFHCPMTVVVTHLIEVLHKGLLEEDYHVRFITMDVTEDNGKNYKIRPGIARKGYGIRTASQFFNQNIIDRAQYFWNLLHHQI